MKTIQQVKQYLSTGKLNSVEQINDGICYEFAEDVFQQLPEKLRNKVQIINSDQFKMIQNEDGPEGNPWDLDYLQKYWNIKSPILAEDERL